MSNDGPVQGSSTARRTPEESRLLIIEGARRALAEVGMGKLTVANIMDRTPLGRSSFYVHFADLDQLTLTLLEENVTLFAEPSAVWFEEPTAENMELALRRILEVWAANRGWWSELISAAMVPRRGLAKQWRTTEVDTWSPMIAALIPGDGPAIRSGSTPDAVARAFVLLLFGVLADQSHVEELDIAALGNDLVGVGLSLLYGAPR